MIEFSNPAALWLLTLSVPLILLYLLKRRRKEMLIPSTMLWKQALEDMRSETPFQKLRSSLLLLLQLLILAVITAILSGPHLVAPVSVSRRWILALDCSASMKATDTKPSRFAAAKAQFSEMLDKIPASDEVLLLAFSSETSMIQQFTNDLSQIRKQLKALEAQDVAGDWRQLLKILEPLVRDKPSPHVVVASDFANVPAGLLSSIALDPLIAGKSQNNAGIIRATTKSFPGAQERQMLLYQVSNFSKSTAKRNVTLYADDSVMDSFDIELDAGATLERTAEITVPQKMKVRIQIKPDDEFSLDDEFVMIVEPLVQISVKLEYENPYLQKALNVLPMVKISPKSPIRIASIRNVSEADESGIYFVSANPKASPAATIHWNDNHPVMRFVDASAWRVRNAKVEVVAGADPLIEIVDGTLVYAIAENNKRKIVLGFALENSNLPSLAGFPVFLQNAILWIHEGIQKPLISTTGGNLKKEGSYWFDGREGYANLADAGESDIEPIPPAARSNSSPVTIQRKMDVAAWFLILVTGIVIVEWWAFHRRIDA